MAGFLLPDEEARLQESAQAARPAPSGNTFLLPGEEDKVRAIPVLRRAVDVNPDEAAQTNALSRAAAIPVPLVQGRQQDIAREEKLKSLRAAMDETPVLARSFANPAFADVAHDDVDNLKSLAGAVAPNTRPVVSNEEYGRRLAEMRRKTPALDLNEARRILDNQVTVANVPDAPQRPAASLGSIAEDFSSINRRSLDTLRANAMFALGKMTGSESITEFASFDRAALQKEDVLSTPKFENRDLQGIYSGVRSLVQQAPLMATGSLPVILGGMGAYTTADAFAKYSERGANAVVAGVAALGEGASEVLTELAPMKLLVNGLGKMGAGKFLTQLLGKEMLGEQINTAVTDAIDTAIANPDKTWGQYIAERKDRAWETALNVFGMVGAMGAVRKAADIVGITGGAAQAAEQDAKALENLFKLTEASKVFERDKDSFASFLQSAAEDGPVQTVYVPAATFAEIAGENLSVLMQEMPSVGAQMEEAIVRGGDLQIPVSEFVTRLAGTGMEKSLLDHIRTSEEGMSREEAKVFMQSEVQNFKAEAEKILATKQADDAFTMSAKKVESDLLAQLTETNRFTDDVNKAYASMVGAFYTTTAQRLGITPEELYQRYQLRFASQTAAGENVMDQKVDLNTPEFKSWFGESKAVDAESKPLMVYTATNADFNTFEPGRGPSKDAVAAWTTDSKDFVNNYASVRYRWWKTMHRPWEEEKMIPSGLHVMPLYVKAENPFDVTSLIDDLAGKLDDATAARVAQALGVPVDALLAGIPEKDVYPNGYERDHNRINADLVRNPAAVAAIKAAGFDSVKATESGSTIFALFNPEQIKSVFNNRPTNSPNILEQGARPIRPEVGQAASIDNARAIAASQKFETNRDFKLALQRAVQNAARSVDLSVDTPALRAYMVAQLTAEARAAIQTNANAIGWYDDKVTTALEIVSEIHPEVLTDAESKFAFIWALAVTSNGIKVDRNFQMAERAYTAWKASGGKNGGRFPTDIGEGTAASKINDHLRVYNELIEKWGFEKFHEFATTLHENRDVEAQYGRAASGEGMDTYVYGAAIVGPKIGNGFFANLYGHFEQLTMDRWWVRMWGRMTADLVKVDPKVVGQKRAGMVGLMEYINSHPEAKREVERIIGRKLSVSKPVEVAETILSKTTKKEVRDELKLVLPVNEAHRARVGELRASRPSDLKKMVSVGDELRKHAKSYLKDIDGQIEVPGGSNRRQLMRDVGNAVLEELRKEHPALTMADFQALLWYPEKTLYDSAGVAEEEGSEGYEDAEAPDYANAAAALAREQGVSDERIQEATRRAVEAVQARRRASGSGRGDGSLPGAAGRGQSGDSAGAAAGNEPGGRVGAGRLAEALATAKAAAQGVDKLRGLPDVPIEIGGLIHIPGPVGAAHRVAADYTDQAGIPFHPVTSFQRVDPERAKRIADAFDAMEHAPNDPEVRAAYQAMIDETLAQWQAIKATGLKVEFVKPGVRYPYEDNPRLAIIDVIENNHLWVFPTSEGFGSDDTDVSGNPLMEMTDEVVDGKRLQANDVFRIVHDYFGHIKDGNGFRADGEENAWRSHAAMYSPLARRAMTVETRGQNSWVNYGPHGEFNRTASGADTIYAPQKLGLLPEWVSEEGRLDEGTQPTVELPSYGQRTVSSVSAVGVHFSHAPRSVLDSTKYGTGMLGAERATVMAGPEALRARTYFYVSEGNGVQAERGVGGVAHAVRLENLYDADADPLKIFRDKLGEQGVVDAGFDGYYSRGAMGQQGVAVLLGAHEVPVTKLGFERDANAVVTPIAPPPAQYAKLRKVAMELVQDQRLPSGQLTPEEWRNTLATVAPDLLEKIPAYTFASNDPVYRDELARVFYQSEKMSVWQATEAAYTSEEGVRLQAALDAATARAVAAQQADAEAVLQTLKQRSPDAAALLENMSTYSAANLARMLLDVELGEEYTKAAAEHNAAENALRGYVMSFVQANTPPRSQFEDQPNPDNPQTATENFKAWFKESKAVINGKPLIALHGTQYDIERFATVQEKGNERLSGDNWMGGLGTWFAAPSTSNEFDPGNETSTANAFAELRGGEGAVVYPVYLSIQNPFEAEGYEHLLEERDAAGGGAALRAKLIANGYDGVVVRDSNTDGGQFRDDWVAFYPEQIKSAIGNDGTFDANDPSILSQAEKVARGQIAMAQDITKSPSTITLLEHADLSTFLHESGHFFLEVLTDIAGRPDAPADIAADMDRILAWFGVPDLPTWRAMSMEAKRPHHEKFARGFEAYLFEGKSPNVEMQSAFQRFRDWLVAVYKQITNLDVKLTDEVRGVMDRLIATDEQIATAQSVRNYEALFKSAQEMGATPEEFAAYQALGREQVAEAQEKLQSRSLRDMAWLNRARVRTIAKLADDAAGKRRTVEAEVRAEVRSQPVYAVQRFLRYGELPEANRTNRERKLLEGIDGGSTKLDLAALRDMYGEGPAAPWRYLPVGKNGMAAAEGVHPDVIAELFGFRSGDHLVRSILDAEAEASVVEGMTDQRMLERYGDINSPQALSRAADQALHNEARGRFLAAELDALNEAANPRQDTGKTATDSRGRTRRVTVSLLPRAARQFAESLVGRRAIRDVKPSQYEAAEARAARAAQAAQKAGKLAEATAEKRNQLVNHYAAMAAERALEDVEKGVAYLKRAAGSESIDIDYRDQIAQLLERFDLRTGQSLKAIDKRKALAAWITEQESLGYDPQISDELRNEAFRKSYRDMTVEEFRGLLDAVENIVHLGRLKKKLLTAADQREFAAVVSELTAEIEDNATRTIEPERVSDRGLLVNVSRLFRGFMVDHRKFASLAREMDGWKDGGKVWDVLIRSMNKAGDTEAVMREKATIALGKLLEPIVKTGGLSKKMDFPKLGKSYTREERIGIALNLGNEVNRERIMTGERLSEDGLRIVMDTLTEQDWAFVQGVWDYLETYRPAIGAKERRLTGKEPDWVEPVPVVTKFGTLRGGYFPIKYDPGLSEKSNADSAAEVQKQLERGLYTRAQTRRGHTKARVESTGRTLRLDFANVLAQHVDQVVHDLSWHEYLIDANRLLSAAPIEQAIREHYGVDKLRTMKSTLTDIAVGDLAAQTGGDRILNYLRKGATVAGLGWRVTTSLLQPIGLTQSMARIGSKWVLKGSMHWAGDAVQLENSVRLIGEKSDFMRLRAKTMQREINEIRNKVSGGDSKIEASYFYLIQKMQLVADVPTWWGAYEKAMQGDNMTEERAVALADQAVRDAQGGGQIGDLARVQRGSPGWKLFSNFYSFFNTTYNLNVEAIGRTKSITDVPMLAVDLLLINMVPAMLGTLLKAALAGDWDDEDKLVRKLIADQANYLLGQVMLLREAGAAVQSVLGEFGDYGGPASVRFFNDLAKLGKQVSQGEADEAFWKSLNAVGGTLFHYPAGQINATASGLAAMSDGETNPGVLLVGGQKR